METDRLNVKIPKEQMERLDSILPWGVRSAVVRGLLEAFERDFPQQGFALTGAIIAGQVKLVMTGDGSEPSQPVEQVVSKIETSGEETSSGPATS